ncbi:MAG TPA: BlaI/MecI/CopY family transcriptional regulator, partial [Edaphobacter sp.]
MKKKQIPYGNDKPERRERKMNSALLTNLLVVRLYKYGPQFGGLPGVWMPPRRSNTLTEAELRLMKVLWERGESGVAEVVAALEDTTPLAYTSVLTTIRILEKKGYVCHRQEGRAFLY